MRTFAFLAAVLAATGLFIKRGLSDGHTRDHTAPRRAYVDAAGVRLVKVVGGAGELRVVGGGGDAVRVEGTAHASRESGLRDVKLEVRRDGDQVVVRAVTPASGARRWWFGAPTQRSLDLVVTVPAALEADVTDGGGDAEVRGVSALRMNDGSGNLRVVDVHGPVRVVDGSGDVELRGVGGDLWVEDGSGEVAMHDVAGSLVVGADGSGGLNASNVRGDVLVRTDGSGDIDVSDVGGRFIVTRDGSGEVRHHDVRGGVQLPAPRRRSHGAHRE